MSRSSGLDGVLLIDKEQGWTSHDVVARVRRITGQRRTGHTGTLDPMATGLLVVCLGQATRLVEYMTTHDKRYEGEITLGVRTDTDDAAGSVLVTQDVPDIGAEQFAALALTFTGELSQLPPSFSAIKVDGKRSYAVARAGGTPLVTPRPVRIHSLELEATDRAHIAVRVHCGSGTYVRSLARDIGEALGCGGHLSRLRRTQVGGFPVQHAVTLSQLETIVANGDIADVLLPADEGVLSAPAAILGAERTRELAQGKPMAPALRFREAPVARVYDVAGMFVAMASVGADGVIKPIKVFVAP